MKKKRSSSPESGSTSHGSSGTKYDVFLSFRGPDTRTTFTDFLYHSLLDKGISVFIDKQGIDVGEEIGPEIYQAIDDSKICIPIFSKDYASSSWCLRELEHMIQRWKTNELEVMPIFYDVEPSDVKLETGVYADALTLHRERHGPEIMQRWMEALKEVTRIKGWDTKNTGHGELAHLIARKVSVKLKVSCVHISDHLVGMDNSANEVVDLLDVKSKDVRLIGMWGMGGIGKTTLAKVVYDKLSTNFDSCSFISDIRAESQGPGLLKVQGRLLSDIIGDLGVELSSIDHGINMTKNRFCRKKVFIVLDDVDQESQLMALAAKKEWFGLGSRIVVTTRDRSVFCKLQDQFERCLIYEVKELNNLTALQLFSKHTFRSNFPPNTFLSLSEKVVAKTGGLPLAIEVIGSLLCGKKEERVWRDTLKKMEYCQHRDVKEKLMLSYQALDHLQQQIFLDIACFLAGEDKSYPYYMWDDCGFFPSEGIDVLILMSLVKIGEDNELRMHDQLKDLGKSIVYEENCKDPTKGSRVWRKSQGGLDIVRQNKGTGTVATYYYRFMRPIQNSVLTSKDFIEVPNIRCLRLNGWTLCGDFGDLFSELRWLTWYGCCPQEMQATNFCPKNLVILDFTGSFIDEHWAGWTQLKVATRLKVLKLKYCTSLKETPDLSAFLSLELLILGCCGNLTKLPNSIGMLKCLVVLNVSHTKIAELPNTIVNLKSLKVLMMDGSSMQKLPESIGMMEKLEEIHGNNCTKLEIIPSDIGRLPFLKILALTETRVENVPELPQSLESLCLSSSAVEKVPEIFNPVNLPTLRKLELCFSKGNAETFVYYKSERHAFYSSLHMKLLSNTGVSSFGGCLHCAKELELIQCKTLLQIQQLPSGLRKLKISDCSLLEVVDLSNLENLLELNLIKNPICDIQGLEGLASLQCLTVQNCMLCKFSGLETLKNLQFLQLECFPSLRTLPNLSNLKNLEEFRLWNCPKLVEIEGLDKLESLDLLHISRCNSLRSFPDLPL